MQMSVTFRHMDATEALKEYAHEKVERIRKYFPDPLKAHVVLECNHGHHHHADVVITLHNGIVIAGKETTEDMYSSIDLVMSKIERQVRRYKEKLRAHKGGDSIHGQREVRHSVMSIADETPPSQQPQFKIIRESKFVARPLTPEEAVMQMNLLNNDFLVYTCAGSHDVNVVYRRGDGTYGLIETGKGGAKA